MFINIPISNLSRVYIRVYTTTSSSVSRVRRNRTQGSSSSNFVLSSSLSSLRSFPFRVMHARRSALELKLKCAHDLISIWGEGRGERAIKPMSARPIVARNIVVAQVQSPRTDTTCYRSGTTLSRRINRGLRFSKFHRNFLLLISASRKHVETRIFRMRGTRIPLPRMGCEQRRTENERKLKKEFLWWKGRKD